MKIAALLVLTATATVALAVPTTYPDKTSFLSSIRGNAFASGVYATPTFVFFPSPQTRSNTGWSVSIQNTNGASNAIFTGPNGTGSSFIGDITTVSTGVRPATAASMQVLC